MKVLSNFNVFLILGSVLWLSCSAEISEPIKTTSSTSRYTSLKLVPGQVPLPNSIKSVQFHQKGNPESVPIIGLNSNDRLVVGFDELSSVSGQFLVRFTHHNENWERSNQPDAFLFDGFSEFTVQNGQLVASSRPNYYSYNFEFPNREIEFKISGNYLMEVVDFQLGVVLFSLPFFITESVGELNSRALTQFNSGALGSASDEVSGRYRHPNFVKFPNFELKVNIYQNRFWANSLSPREIDIATEHYYGFRLTRDQLYPAYFDFNLLDLETLSLQNPQIFGFEPGVFPNKVELRDDYLNFSSEPRVVFSTGFGTPSVKDGQYVQTTFRFEDGATLGRETSIYLIGDFNQWTTNPRNQLVYNNELSVYETDVLLKQGVYQYKYVTQQNGEIFPLTLNDSMTKNQQEYTVLVYYKDPELLYDRLLAVQQFISVR